ncbi:MAG: hypothetical protein CL853_04725 [Crocinitomicaceae bacterium]|nr:hypothetical protein [Crocinitomicaceae bacterium]|tara:strand:- start:2718 stop:5243 length:2526 start_codon:yes stop_codon:yes gene_type:complete
MKHKLIFFVFLPLLISINGYCSYIKGKVVDENNEPLPFATVYIHNTTYGVTTNTLGDYFIELKPGNYDITYSFIGYQSVIHNVELSNKPITIDVKLQSSSTQLNELEIYSNTKNKAKEVMANVRKNRKKHLNSIHSYSCSTYLKNSLIKELINAKTPVKEKAPKDSIEEEILNLIESYSITNFQAPNSYKEAFFGYHDFADTEKESGLDISAEFGYGEYSIVPDNQQLEDPYLLYTEVSSGDFNLYKNAVEIKNVVEKPVISPLSLNGVVYYKYDFEGSFYNNDKNKIYKIKVTPLFKGEPLFKGFLFIEDSTFSLQSIELSISGPMLFCKNFNLIQDYSKIDNNIYVPTRREINYTIKDGKYQIIGNARIAHSHYKVNTSFEKKFFNAELRTYEDSAYNRDSSFWNKIRPITLQERELHYIETLDSLKEFYHSEKYLLSQDSALNKITLTRILFSGIYRRNLFKGNEFYIEPLVSQFNFLGIGGYRHRIGTHFNKAFKNDFLLETDTEIDYGFRNKDVKGNIGIGLTYVPKKFVRTYIELGDYYDLINSFASLTSAFSRSNYVRKRSINIAQRMELFNGFYAEAKINYSNMISLAGLEFASWENQISYEDSLNTPAEFQDYIKTEIRLQLTYIPKQQYYFKRNKKIILGSKLPTFNIIYRKGLPGIFNSEVNFDYIEAGVFDEINFPQLGSSKWNIQLGSFINKNNLRIIEWKYFRGSDIFFFSNPLKSFQLIGPTLSTSSEYIRGNYMHHFEGNILNKIPLIHYLKLSLAGGAGFLLMPSDDVAHGEIFAGIERVTRIKETLLRFGFYAITAENNLQSPNLSYKFGISLYNPFSRKWDY